MRRVVVTGIGATTPLGGDATSSWKALLEGKSGISTIEAEWVSKYELPVTFAGQAKVPSSEVLTPQEAKRLDPSSQLALISAREAWKDAGEPEVAPERLARTAVSACASGNESIANAFQRIRLGEADVVVAGGAEAAIHPLPIAAFAAMQALSKRNDSPQKASRPYDTDRDGFVMSEGAGALVLEDYESAKARGAKIYCEIVGAAVTSDAYHITAPDPEGSGAARAVLGALSQAGALPTDVEHVNAHATSTPVGDIAEYTALKRVFGDHTQSLMVTATKSQTGHLLGGAGAIEAIFTILALKEQMVLGQSRQFSRFWL